MQRGGAGTGGLAGSYASAGATANLESTGRLSAVRTADLLGTAVGELE